MIPRSSRLAICCIAFILSSSLYIKGRVPTGKGEGAAFLRSGPRTVKVRLAGDLPSPGLYLFPDGVATRTAIRMTLPAASFASLSGAIAGAPLRSGDIVTLTRRPGKSSLVSLGKMGVKERMLLKIPLDPDLLDAAEWSLLPGIGEVLAGRIVADRQKYGAFRSVEGLLRVPGVGPGKLAGLRRYF